LEGVGVDGKIILKWIFRMRDGKDNVQWTLGFPKMRGIFGLAGNLSSQEELWSNELVNFDHLLRKIQSYVKRW
jgi:hypothetical protein